MLDIKEILPLFIPFVIIEFILLAVTIKHILSHQSYKMGNRTIWLIVVIVGMNLIGPIFYFLLGREDA